MPVHSQLAIAVRRDAQKCMNLFVYREGRWQVIYAQEEQGREITEVELMFRVHGSAKRGQALSST
jgi:hypothetical protein